MQFRRVSGRDSAQVVTPFVQVGTSWDSTVTSGTDYAFISRCSGGSFPADIHVFHLDSSCRPVERSPPTHQDRNVLFEAFGRILLRTTRSHSAFPRLMDRF